MECYNGKKLNDDGSIKRDDLDVFYLKMAYLVSERSTCLRRQVGCVIVKDKVLLATGYNGASCGKKHCTINTCQRIKNNVKSGDYSYPCIAAHAEMNAIANSAKIGAKINNSTLYVTASPCFECSKVIANSGIKRIVYCETYGSGISDIQKEILKGIELIQISKDLLN